jgi:hypothetical protein
MTKREYHDCRILKADRNVLDSKGLIHSGILFCGRVNEHSSLSDSVDTAVDPVIERKIKQLFRYEKKIQLPTKTP